MFIKSCIVGGSLPVAAFLLSFSSVSFAQNADLPQYSSKFAPYVVTPEHAVDRMLEVANLKPGETLFDLGCGDGRVLITAVQKYNVKAVGIEISDHLARSAAEKVKKQGLQDRIKIVHGDFMRQDLSSANVVTLYLATTANDTLRPNLERFLKPNTRGVSYDYPIPGWKPIETTEAKGTRGIGHTIYLYQVPESMKK